MYETRKNWAWSQVTATRRGDTSQPQIASWVLRIFVKICLRNRILSLQQVEKNQSRLKLYDLLRRQNSVAATNIFTKFLQCKRSVLSLQRVSVTCCCNLSPSVYRTYPGFYLAMSFTVYRSAAQLCSITEIAPKSPFLYVNRNPI